MLININKDTIFAVASALGRAGVAVLRVSGPRAFEAGRDLCGSLGAPRQAVVRRLTAEDGQVLDEAIVVCFPGPGSFTGEDVVEFHLHGSRAVVASVLSRLGEAAGLRLAEPGEFTRRAFENGRIDLAQAEGLSDLVDAETEVQRQHAIRAMSGELREQVTNWRRFLIEALALVEAQLDFADEDVSEATVQAVLLRLTAVWSAIRNELSGVAVAERLRSGFEIAIVGAPNAGKSTLLNRLARRDAAIVSDEPGTTRDVLEVHMDLEGIPVTFLDTAGLREVGPGVEALGIERARDRAAAADLVVHLKSETGDVLPVGLRADISLMGKSDLGVSSEQSISGLTGEGVNDLLALIRKELEGRVAQIGVAMRDRHRFGLQRAEATISVRKFDLESGGQLDEFAAQDLRDSMRALDSLIGQVDVEDVLDEVFGRFCLGK